MRVLFLPSWYSSNKDDLTGSFIYDLAKALNQKNLSIDVCYVDLKSISRLRLSDLKKYNGSTYVNIEEGIRTVRHKSFRLPRITSYKGKKWVNKSIDLVNAYINEYGKPDLIHAHSVMWAGEVAAMIKEKYSIPFIITEHRGRFVKQSRIKIQKDNIERIKVAVNSSDELIVVSEAIKPFFQELDCNNIILLPNYVDDFFFEDINSQKGNTIVLSSICHLTKNKNIDKVLIAFEELLKSYSNLELIIGGAGDEFDNLKKISEKLSLNGKVHFKGLLSRLEVKKVLQESDIFILPSEFESFGLVYVEAMAQGLPVIATQNGGPKYFVTDSVGELVDPQYVDDIIRKTKKVIANLKSYNSNEISEYAKSKFSKDIVVHQLINLYSKYA